MKKITLSFFSLLSIVSVAQSLSPTGSITAPGSADNFKGGYTFAYATSGTPWNGSLISFGGFANQYDTQISSAYNGNSMSFRTRNGDFNVWNSWNELATKGANDFMGKQTIMGNVGIGTQAPSEKLTVSGDHQNSIILLHSSGDGVNSPANLSLWASEPQETYTGVGIGNNVRNYGTGQSFPRINTNLGGSYIRLLENHINFNLISNTGIKKQIATLYSDRFEVNTLIYSKESSNEEELLFLKTLQKLLEI